MSVKNENRLFGNPTVARSALAYDNDETTPGGARIRTIDTIQVRRLSPRYRKRRDKSVVMTTTRLRDFHTRRRINHSVSVSRDGGMGGGHLGGVISRRAVRNLSRASSSRRHDDASAHPTPPPPIDAPICTYENIIPPRPGTRLVHGRRRPFRLVGGEGKGFARYVCNVDVSTRGGCARR